ncbi:hypothetical protein ACEUZ9_000799 [Paracoccus litorisediminis]|uniref:hypothetical protein n=1 Tax=Paracoccus litorisediminis TaxID=2006130 RepID=UPI00372E2E4C
MADRWKKHRAAGRPLRPADLRQERLYDALSRPRTQAELRDLLGMSNSGILSLLRRMERGGVVSPAERVSHTRIWERRQIISAATTRRGS